MTLSKLLNFSELLLLHRENLTARNTCPVHLQGCFANSQVDPKGQGRQCNKPAPVWGSVGPGSTRFFRWEPSVGLSAALVRGGAILCRSQSACGPAHALVDICSPQVGLSQERPQDGRETMGTAMLTGGQRAEAAVVKGTPCILGQQRRTDPRISAHRPSQAAGPWPPEGACRGEIGEVCAATRGRLPGRSRCLPSSPPSRGAEPEGFVGTRYSGSPGDRLTREL